MTKFIKCAKKIYCCGCEKDVNARLTTGGEVYPHRQDLKHLPFWVCDNCKNFVGCHHKSKNKTQPLGVIATKNIKRLRVKIHAVIDPLWKSKAVDRKKIYKEISDAIGRDYHTANIKTEDEAENIIHIVEKIKKRVS